MAFSTIYLIPVVGAAFLVYQYILIPFFLSPLAKIPAANSLAKVSDLWILYIRWRNIENQTVLALHEKLGPIVRLAPNELSVNCYEGGIKTIYQGGFAKHEFYAGRFVAFETLNMFTMANNHQHSERKRLISNVYSKSNVYASPTVRATATKIVYDRFLPLLEKSAATSEPVEMLKLSHAFSMDSFMTFQFGMSIGPNFLQDVKERDWYVEAYFSSKPYYFWIDQLPGLMTLLAKVGIHIMPAWTGTALEELEAWILDKCDRAEALLSSGKEIAPEDVPAVYGQESAAINKWGGAPVNPEPQKYPYRMDLASDAFDHSAAAIETSGNSLTWVFYEMARRPDLQKALRKELLHLDPPVQINETELPDFKQLDGLPLLEAVLKETLRCWPVIPGGQPRVTPSPSCSLAGYDNIPPNVKVHSAAGVIHRNPEIFPDPYKWEPNRWLDASDAQIKEMNHWFWAFGSGGRMCIGSNFAQNAMKLMIAAVYTNFTTSIVDAEGIEAGEGFIAGPIGEKLVLQFHKV